MENILIFEKNFDFPKHQCYNTVTSKDMFIIMSQAIPLKFTLISQFLIKNGKEYSFWIECPYNEGDDRYDGTFNYVYCQGEGNYYTSFVLHITFFLFFLSPKNNS